MMMMIMMMVMIICWWKWWWWWWCDEINLCSGSLQSECPDRHLVRWAILPFLKQTTTRYFWLEGAKDIVQSFLLRFTKDNTPKQCLYLSYNNNVWFVMLLSLMLSILCSEWSSVMGITCSPVSFSNQLLCNAMQCIMPMQCNTVLQHSPR